MLPKITAKQAQEFAKVWTHKGVAIVISDIHCEFAASFAQVVLQSFVEQAQRDAARRLAEANAKKIVSTEV